MKDVKSAEVKRDYAIFSLKVKPKYFEALKDGTKNFELRKMDRDFRVGDMLELCEYDSDKGFTGRKIMDNCKCKLNSCFNQEHLSIA